VLSGGFILGGFELEKDERFEKEMGRENATEESNLQRNQKDLELSSNETWGEKAGKLKAKRTFLKVFQYSK
jgi:hypothetical protein